MKRSFPSGKRKGIVGGRKCTCKDVEVGDSVADFGIFRVPWGVWQRKKRVEHSGQSSGGEAGVWRREEALLHSALPGPAVLRGCSAEASPLALQGVGGVQASRPRWGGQGQMGLSSRQAQQDPLFIPG